MEREFIDGEQALVAYFEATYVGRPVPNGMRRQMYGPACWGVESRTHAWPHRANKAAGAFNNAFACTVFQADRHHIGMFMGASHLQQNTQCAATKTVSTKRPIADRELDELDEGLRKNVEKGQEDRNARLAAIAARFAEDGDIARLMIGIDHNYMCARFETL